jgi:hypothetical protein
MHLPKPKSWDEFEDMVCDVMKIRWNNSNVTRHGRLGQVQQGVDIYGNNELKVFSGVQCKNTISGIQEDLIKKEVENAESFRPEIKILYIATTADTDAKLQKFVLFLSEARKNKGLFSLEILFWNDIQQDIIKDKDMLKKYYPQIFPPIGVADEYENQGNKKLCAFSIAYKGLRLSEYIELLFGEMGMLANEDPGQLTQLCVEIKAYAKQLYENQDYEDIYKDLNEIETLCFKKYESKEESELRWEKVISLAKIAETKIRILEIKLSGDLLKLFTLGQILGYLDSQTFDTFEEYHAAVVSYHKIIIDTFKVLGVVDSELDGIDKRLKDAEREESFYIFNMPAKLYSIAKERIKMGS